MPSFRSPPPVNAGRLPGSLPGEFGGLRRPGGTQRLRVAGSLPSSLPGNFNNIVPPDDIPYGSIGYTLICRSARDFTTILGIFYDYLNMSYSEELSGVGAGTVVFDLESEEFLNQLIDSNDPDSILTRDNLWEVYFDGVRRFMWLGQNVSEPQVSSNEDHTVTISGPGLADSLDWAKVLPNRFPAPMPKIETLQDDFVDQTLDVYGKWKGSGGSTSGNVTVANAELNINVTGTGNPGTYVASDYAYDFEESGCAVRVEPYVGSTGSGFVRTYLRIEESDTAYVGMFVERASGIYYLVAEANGPGGYVKQQVQYSGATQKHWRIQEKDGTAIFSYRASFDPGSEWTTLAVLPYSMNPTLVRLRLWALAVAGTGLTLPKTSQFAELSTAGVESALPPLESFRRLILKAQARGSIKHIIPDWTPAADSMGAAWTGSISAEASLGAGLATVLNDYCQSNQADWLFTSDYRLQIRQRVYAAPGAPDPTAPYHKEDKVIFYEQESQLSKDKNRSYSEVANYLVGATSNGEYAVVTNPASIGEYQQREELISDTLSASDTNSLYSSLSNQLLTKKDGVLSWSLQVAHGLEGKCLYKDYQLGDWVSVQSSGASASLDSWRIAAISVSVSGEDDPNIELTLNAKLDPYWIKLERKVSKSKYGYPIKRPFNWPSQPIG